MNNFGEYLTPEQAFKKKVFPGDSLADYKRKALLDEECMVCGQPIWKLVDTGMCFTCTTGEADASEDYELIPG